MPTKPTHPEYQYLDLLREALAHGSKKVDRGTDIKLFSLFGRQTRYDLSQGFPLLTTKKVYWKGVLHELYWFMSGNTNIKYLVDNNVHIWDAYPYKIYQGKSEKQNSVLANDLSSEALAKAEAKQSDSGQARMTISKVPASSVVIPASSLVIPAQAGIQSSRHPETSSGSLPYLTQEEFIEKIKTDNAFAKKYGNLPRIYGEMWRRWPVRNASRSDAGGSTHPIDQLSWVLQELKDDPDAKNLIVTSWNPEYLYTMATNEDASRFPICHNMYQISQRDGKLSLQLYQRSADLFLGVPFNIASYALLTMILAKIAGYEPGEFIHTFGDVHIYENHIPQVKEQLTRKPRPFPTIKFTHDFKTLDEFRPEYVELVDYDPYPMMKAELTVAGGLYDPKTGKMAR